MSICWERVYVLQRVCPALGQTLALARGELGEVMCQRIRKLH